MIIGALFLVAAVYYYYTPVLLTTSTGALFGCGSAAHPPTAQFPKATCLDAPNVNLYKAIALLASAVIVVVLGWIFFGADRTVQASPQREEDDALDAT